MKKLIVVLEQFLIVLENTVYKMWEPNPALELNGIIKSFDQSKLPKSKGEEIPKKHLLTIKIPKNENGNHSKFANFLGRSIFTDTNCLSVRYDPGSFCNRGA